MAGAERRDMPPACFDGRQVRDIPDGRDRGNVPEARPYMTGMSTAFLTAGKRAGGTSLQDKGGNEWKFFYGYLTIMEIFPNFVMLY